MKIEQEKNIGKWSSSIETATKLVLKISGEVPTNGEKPRFALEKAVPQGTNIKILLLDFKPDLAKEKGPGLAQVFYSEVLDTYDKYDSVQVRGKDRDLAFFEIEKIK